MNIARISKSVLMTGAATAVICISQPAFAQSAPDDSTESSSAEIIVTAQKREQRLTDVPISITAASGEQIRNQGIVDTAQLVKLVPGFSFQKGPYGAPIYAIRGVGFSDRAWGSAPAVSVYVDQVPLPYSTVARGATLDLERVEVLKGPQGTLFGQNSTGGAVNYIAAKPSREFHAGADISFGRFNDIDMSGFVSGPLSNTLSARLAVRMNSADGWQVSATRPNDRLGKKSFTQARLLVDFNPSDTVRFELNLTGWQDRSESQANQYKGFRPANGVTRTPFNDYIWTALLAAPIAGSDNRTADWDPNYNFKRHDDFYLASLRAEVDLTDDITLTSITAYSHFKGDMPMDSDGTAFADSRVNHQRALLTSFSEELRIAGSSGPLQWMVGGNYQSQKAEQTNEYTQNSNQDVSGPFIFTEPRLLFNQYPKTISAFGNLEYSITPQLTVQGSVRYSDQKRPFNGCLADNGPGQFGISFAQFFTIVHAQNPPIQPGACVTKITATGKTGLVTSNLNEDNLSWRAGINFKPSDRTLLYVNVTKGFKSGSYSVVPAVFDIQLQPVTQESVLSYEAGFKTSVLDRKVDISAAVFHYDYRDKQLLGNAIFPIFGRLPSLINIPRSRITGGEIAITARPVDGLSLSGGITYMDSKVLKDPTGIFSAFDFVGSTTTFVGDAFPNTPKWQAVLDGEYSFPVTDRVNFFVGGTITHQSSTYAVFGSSGNYPTLQGTTATTFIDGYTLGDIRAGVESRDGTWRVQGFVRNVADKNYTVGADRVIDTFSRTAGAPRTYGLTVTFRH
jgi:outer membrane receptor protein involved in Fe transport